MGKRKTPVKTDSVRQPVTLDGWVNVVTAIGLKERDKLLNATFCARVVSFEDAEQLWLGDDIAAKAIEMVPDEMLRLPWKVKLAKKKKQEEAIGEACKQLQVTDKFKEAMRYERAYGGGGIFVGADDGSVDLRKPLNLDRIKTIRFMHVLTPRELVAVKYYSDPLEPKYGEPEIYRIQQEVAGSIINARTVKMQEIHETRLILFPGIKVSKRQVRARHGWGDSVFTRTWNIISMFQQSWGGAGNLIQDFSQAVFKIKNLASLIGNNEDDVVVKRAAALDMTRSIARAILIDSEEEFERKSTTVTGLPEMLEKMSLRVSSCLDMPVSLLMGQAPAGMNATGASDIRFFYDRVSAKQEHHLKPRLEYFLKIVMSAKDGPTGGKIPENWSLCFEPLWQMTKLEEAQLRKTNTDSDVALVNAGVLLPEEVSDSRFGGDEYGNEIILNTEARAKMEDAISAAREQGQSGAPIPIDPNKAKPGEEDPKAKDDPKAKKLQPGKPE